MEILEAFDLAQESAEELIMAARADWFASEEEEAGLDEGEGEYQDEESLPAAELPSEAAREATPDSRAEAAATGDLADLSGGADAETRS